MDYSALTSHREVLISWIKTSYPPGRWQYIIADPPSRKRLHSIWTEDEILEFSVSGVLDIGDHREKGQEYPAVYLVQPTPEVAHILSEDLAQSMYAKAHIIWAFDPPRELHEMVQTATRRSRTVVKMSISSTDFTSLGDRIISLNEPGSLTELFHPTQQKLQDRYLRQLGNRVASACVMAGHRPIIRSYRTKAEVEHGQTSRTDQLAQHIHESVNVLSTRPGPPTGETLVPAFREQAKKETASMVVVDRTVDLVAPLLHEMTYEAAVKDLVELKSAENPTFKFQVPGDKNKGEAVEDCERALDENDWLWKKYRYKSMIFTSDALIEEHKLFLATNPIASSENQKATIGLLVAMNANQPKFKGEVDLLMMHLDLAREANTTFQKTGMNELVPFEQSLATARDAEGADILDPTGELIELLAQPQLTADHRRRLLLIFFLFRDGLVDSDLGLLLRHAGLDPGLDKNLFKALQLIGGPPIRQFVPNRIQPVIHPMFPTRDPPAAKQETRAEKLPYFYSRYVTNIKNVVEQHILNTLDHDQFRFVDPAGKDAYTKSLSDEILGLSHRTGWAGGGTWAASRQAVARQRLVGKRFPIYVVVVGGVTMSEIRDLDDLGRENSKDIIVIASHLIQPRDHLLQMLSLDRPYRPTPAPRLRAPASSGMYRPGPGQAPAPGSRQTPTNGSPHPSSLQSAGQPQRWPTPQQQQQQQRTYNQGPASGDSRHGRLGPPPPLAPQGGYARPEPPAALQAGVGRAGGPSGQNGAAPSSSSPPEKSRRGLLGLLRHKR